MYVIFIILKSEDAFDKLSKLVISPEQNCFGFDRFGQNRP